MRQWTTPANYLKIWEIQEYLTKFSINENGCWIWPNLINPDGYGYIHYESERYLAHRFMYELIKGQTLPKHKIDHLCFVKPCINPAHLEEVTQKENVRRYIRHSKKNPRLLGGDKTYSWGRGLVSR